MEEKPLHTQKIINYKDKDKTKCLLTAITKTKHTQNGHRSPRQNVLLLIIAFLHACPILSQDRRSPRDHTKRRCRASPYLRLHLKSGVIGFFNEIERILSEITNQHWSEVSTSL